MRVVSMQSKAKVYHREECRYAKKILPKNRMQLSSEAAEKAGYHICPYCDGMHEEGTDFKICKKESYGGRFVESCSVCTNRCWMLEDDL